MITTRVTAVLSSLTLAAIGAAGFAPPAHAGTPTGEILASALYSRQGPSTHAKATFQYRKGERVPLGCKVTGTVVGGNNLWYSISGSDDRWISARYVKNIGAAPEFCDPLDGYVKGRTTRALSARQGPHTLDKRLTTYRSGTTLKIQCKVTSQKVSGNSLWYLTSSRRWVSARYVKNLGQAPRQCGEGGLPE